MRTLWLLYTDVIIGKQCEKTRQMARSRGHKVHQGCHSLFWSLPNPTTSTNEWYSQHIQAQAIIVCFILSGAWHIESSKKKDFITMENCRAYFHFRMSCSTMAEIWNRTCCSSSQTTMYDISVNWIQSTLKSMIFCFAWDSQLNLKIRRRIY